MIINVEINDEKLEINIPEKNLTKAEAIERLYSMIAFGRTCAIAHAGDTIFCSSKESKDIEEIEEILKEVQTNGFP